MTTLTISYKKSSCNHKGTEWGEFAHSNVYRRHGCRELDQYSVTLLIRIQPGKKTEKWEEKDTIKRKDPLLSIPTKTSNLLKVLIKAFYLNSLINTFSFQKYSRSGSSQRSPFELENFSPWRSIGSFLRLDWVCLQSPRLHFRNLP